MYIFYDGEKFNEVLVDLYFLCNNYWCSEAGMSIYNAKQSFLCKNISFTLTFECQNKIVFCLQSKVHPHPPRHHHHLRKLNQNYMR